MSFHRWRCRSLWQNSSGQSVCSSVRIRHHLKCCWDFVEKHQWFTRSRTFDICFPRICFATERLTIEMYALLFPEVNLMIRTTLSMFEKRKKKQKQKNKRIGQSSVLCIKNRSRTYVQPNLVRALFSLIATRLTCSLQMRYRLYNPMHSLLVRLFDTNGTLQMQQRKKNKMKLEREKRNNELIQI